MAAAPSASRALMLYGVSVTRASAYAAPKWVCRSCQRAQGRLLSTRVPEPASMHTSAKHPGKLVGQTRPDQMFRSRARFSTSAYLREGNAPRPQPGAQTPSQQADRIQAAGDTLLRLATVARQSWNEMVGYTDIEKGRARVAEQEESIQACKTALASAREAHRAAIDKHAMSLRETRDLLAHKDDWTGEDAARFAMLHRATRAEEAEEKNSRRALTDAEVSLERETEKLSARIGEVYQAESMYNAKILQVKTWWTWVLMAFNVTVFLFNVYLIQIGLNPRYRRDMDLSDKAVAKIRAALLETAGEPPEIGDAQRTIWLAPRLEGDTVGESVTAQVNGKDTIQAVKDQLAAQHGLAAQALHMFFGDVELSNDTKVSDLLSRGDELHLSFSTENGSDTPLVVTNTDRSNLPTAVSLQVYLKSLFSPEPVTWKMADITTLALQSAVTGAAAAAMVAIALQKR